MRMINLPPYPSPLQSPLKEMMFGFHAGIPLEHSSNDDRDLLSREEIATFMQLKRKMIKHRDEAE